MQDDEAHMLRFTCMSSLNFQERTIQLTHAGVGCLPELNAMYTPQAVAQELWLPAVPQFACGNCRALLDCERFIKFAAWRLTGSHGER
jgi:hypothetical protein